MTWIDQKPKWYEYPVMLAGLFIIVGCVTILSLFNKKWDKESCNDR